MTILRPDLLDYEGQREFTVVIEAYDLVTPVNERRHVREGVGFVPSLNHLVFVEFYTADSERDQY